MHNYHYCPLKIKQAVVRIYPDYAAYTDYSGEQIVSQLLIPLKIPLRCCVNGFTKHPRSL